MPQKRFLSLFLILSIGAATFLAGCAGSKSRLKLGETAEGEVVEAEGLAAVTDDKIAVKRAALSDAYKNAVEKVVGIFISARTMVDKAITIQQNILGKTDGYVKKHDVIREGLEADGLYHTHIRALVSYQQIQNDLRDLNLIQTSQVGNPRVAVLLDEKFEGADVEGSPCADAISQTLLERGYKVVDRSDLAAIRVAEATQQLLQGNSEAALKPIIQKLNAEVIISGQVKGSVLAAEGLGGLISVRATLNGKAIRAQTGDILYTFSIQASGLDGTKEAASQKALAQAGKNAGNDLAGRIASELARRSTILVMVGGVPSLNVLSEMKDRIVTTPGVADVTMRSFAAGRAEMEVKVNAATSGDIIQSLSKKGTLPMEVVNQTQDSVEVKLP